MKGHSQARKRAGAIEVQKLSNVGPNLIRISLRLTLIAGSRIAAWGICARRRGGSVAATDSSDGRRNKNHKSRATQTVAWRAARPLTAQIELSDIHLVAEQSRRTTQISQAHAVTVADARSAGRHSQRGLHAFWRWHPRVPIVRRARACVRCSTFFGSGRA